MADEKSDAAISATENAPNTSSDTPPVAEDAEDAFSEFYQEVKQIEKRDTCMTSKQQIDRLTRPGSTYFNLNPFDVLQIDADLALPLIKKKYRQLSVLVHPDKNPDDLDRAQKSFEAVNKSFKTLENEEGFRKCKEVIEEAKIRVDDMMVKSRKRLKKEGKPPIVPEDNPETYKHSVYVQTCKLFADMERMRVEKDHKDMHEKKRKAEDDAKEVEEKKRTKEWNKNYEASRTGRVDSWRTWAKSGKKKTSTGMKGHNIGKNLGIKPPQLKPEQR